MENFRPFALSLAGFDPSGGAGVLSDIKTFEAHDVQGFGVTTAITYQTAEDFIGMNWMSADVVTAQLLPLIEKYPLSAMKIGIVEDFHLMSNWIGLVKGFFPTCKIVLDPVLRASAGYDFHDENTIKWLDKVLNSIDLITPNWKEMEILANGGDVLEKAKELSQKTHVLLKGGHHPTHKGDDILLYKGQEIVIEGKDINAYEKHGSGCVLSSAIAGQLAHGKSIEEACRRGKDYIEKFLESDPSRLGQHTVLVQHD
ncbi:hydroxymethylpyrimidine/phosphomethylpyrimidine kinase [Flammeovirga sp. MY04]|uniref:hydroxymethylpyrimidine/phosphomethylpyrimidine kinase n=1 Tax=Flammeovirga sp. MY04 TaxID=1191459 RepID=UPI00080611DB|nr:hydroxymethylpyrimidine/phosphomethylpyrimidine kinase [Flammeovirga sp. MY04]ANQ50158.1 hydroxymethylpyrimidine/phosphomethylpyrimidine kinase [Flammeovirga sp. MY04]